MVNGQLYFYILQNAFDKSILHASISFNQVTFITNQKKLHVFIINISLHFAVVWLAGRRTAEGAGGKPLRVVASHHEHQEGWKRTRGVHVRQRDARIVMSGSELFDPFLCLNIFWMLQKRVFSIILKIGHFCSFNKQTVIKYAFTFELVWISTKSFHLFSESHSTKSNSEGYY